MTEDSDSEWNETSDPADADDDFDRLDEDDFVFVHDTDF
jgi:hypothetical protein